MKELKQLTDEELIEYYQLYSNMVANSTRAEKVKIDGFDIKFGMHVVRLLDYVEQLLSTGELDMRRNKEQFKAIRRGDMTEQEIREWASSKEKQLEMLFRQSTLPESPSEEKVKSILLNCLEIHYGNLTGAIEDPNAPVNALREIQAVIDRHKAAIWS